MSCAFSFFEIRTLKSRASRDYDPLSHPADQTLFMISIYKKSPSEQQLFIDLLYRFVMKKINSQGAITELGIFKEIAEYRAGNSSALRNIDSHIAFLQEQLRNG
ncbi:hypothetical protein BDP27DRAFT_1423010 [Rhodocollybia butyracea]|uniref:Uncharacterized protein n=1 Tax=Rhodocollybia butyracea TaxID=206335 RepID=A0A9P5U612_9AGAR|nr:hypothetical protein BDP27DRAFT_1423010 [Rhodocollybia butyracea]